MPDGASKTPLSSKATAACDPGTRLPHESSVAGDLLRPSLCNTLDGRQTSYSWLVGSRTSFDRVQNAVGDLSAVDDIHRALASNRVGRWVVHTDHHGGVSVGLLDPYGRFIPRPDMISKILGK